MGRAHRNGSEDVAEQQTFADLDDNSKKRKTRRERMEG